MRKILFSDAGGASVLRAGQNHVRVRAARFIQGQLRGVAFEVFSIGSSDGGWWVSRG